MTIPITVIGGNPYLQLLFKSAMQVLDSRYDSENAGKMLLPTLIFHWLSFDLSGMNRRFLPIFIFMKLVHSYSFCAARAESLRTFFCTYYSSKSSIAMNLCIKFWQHQRVLTPALKHKKGFHLLWQRGTIFRVRNSLWGARGVYNTLIHDHPRMDDALY